MSRDNRCEISTAELLADMRCPNKATKNGRCAGHQGCVNCKECEHPATYCDDRCEKHTKFRDYGGYFGEEYPSLHTRSSTYLRGNSS